MGQKPFIWSILSMVLLPISAAANTPTLDRGEALELYATAGFPISADGDHPTNRCGQSANPFITFVDMNGDGRKEALIVDQGPCYKQDRRWYAVVTKDASGHWRRLVDGEGSVRATGTQFNGWFVLATTLGGKTSKLYFDGTRYGEAIASAPSPMAPATPAARPDGSVAPARSLANAPVSQQHLFAGEAPFADAAKALSASEREALFRAAGMARLKNGKWTACSDDVSGNSEADIVMIHDINGDGRNEAVIGDGGTYCNGNAGMASTILTKTASGSWQVMASTQGFVNFLKSHGVDNYPDVEVGLPGFCFPYLRWDGSRYAITARLDDKGNACKPF